MFHNIIILLFTMQNKHIFFSRARALKRLDFNKNFNNLIYRKIVVALLTIGYINIE